MVTEMTDKFKIIDLSLPISSSIQDFIPPKINFISHKKGANILSMGGLISKCSFMGTFLNFMLHFLGIRSISYKNFPDEIGLAWEKIKLETHTGTHLDAPWHFGPTSEGKPSKHIDEIPLEWCYGDGVVLDMRDKNLGEKIEIDDLEKACNKIKYNIKEKDIVLIMTGADKFSTEKKYLFDYVGMSADAVKWVLDKGVKIIGCDSWGFDSPFRYMIKDYFKTNDKKKLWPAHIIGRQKEYCHIEKLVNLDKIPVSYGFKVACFPIKIKGASAGWVRAVAIL